MSKRTCNFLLLLTAMIWGGGFVAQSLSVGVIGPWAFNGLRSLIAGVTLWILIPLLDKVRGVKRAEVVPDQKFLLHGGIYCGLVVAMANMLQQTGIQYTTVGKAGFITSLYILFVPILSLFLGKRIRPLIWVCILIAAIGLYFLTMSGTLSLSKGDLLVFICAILYSIHILVIDHFSPHTDGVRLSCIQFFTAGVVCMTGAFLFEKVDSAAIAQALGAILYAGIISSGAGYTLQILGQKKADPTTASLLMSLESVFSVIFGFLFLKQMMSVRELFGCVLMFAAIVLAQLPEKSK